MAKKKLKNDLVTKIASTKSMVELVELMKDVPFSERTKEVVIALFEKMEEFMPKRIK